MVSCSAGISMLNTMTGSSALTAAVSTRFIENEVFPIDGRPATMIRSPYCRPAVFRSRSSNPVGTPVIGLSRRDSSSMRSITLTSTSRMATDSCRAAPPRSAISKMRRSASSSRSSAARPSGRNAASAISVLVRISSRSTARSRTISAYAAMFAALGVFSASSAR